MKTAKIAAMMMVAALTAGTITACDDDDDTKSVAEQVAGTYGTYSLANAKYFSNMFTDEEDGCVELTAFGPASVKAVFTSKTWGTFTIDTAAVAASSEGGFSLSGNGKCEMPGMNGKVSTYDATISGTVNGENTKIDFTAPTVMGGTTVTVYNTAVPEELLAAQENKSIEAE